MILTNGWEEECRWSLERTVTTRFSVNKRGMVDLVALPVWVGTLVGLYGFDPQAAGGLPTLFLIGASIASILIAPRLNRLNTRFVVVAGFGIGALLLLSASLTQAYGMLVALHLAGGARDWHSGRGVLWGGAPGIIAKFVGPTLFLLLGALMAPAALISLFFFPATRDVMDEIVADKAAAPLSKEIWFCIGGIALLCTAQSIRLRDRRYLPHPVGGLARKTAGGDNGDLHWSHFPGPVCGDCHS